MVDFGEKREGRLMNTLIKEPIEYVVSKEDAIQSFTKAFKKALNDTQVNLRDLTWFSSKELSSSHPARGILGSA